MNTKYLIKFISSLKNLEKNCFFLTRFIDLRENMHNNFGKYLGNNRSYSRKWQVMEQGELGFFSPHVCRIQELSK
jgi:hypothetical protein